jgi:hypothetical protein
MKKTKYDKVLIKDFALALSEFKPIPSVLEIEDALIHFAS